MVVPAAFGDVAGDFILDLSAPKSELHVDVALRRRDRDAADDGAAAPGRRDHPGHARRGDLDARSLGLPSTINGLIGADVLAGYVVDIRFDPCRVRLWRGRAPPLHAIATLPIELADGVPSIPATIADARGVALAGRFAIDTGTAAVRLSSQAASLSRTLGKDVDPASRLDPPARLEALGLAGVALRRLPAALEDDLPPTLTGGVGTAAWSHYEVRVDLRRGRLQLSQRPSAASVRDVPPDLAVARVEHAGEDQQVDHHGDAHLLALVHLRVRRPLQERRHVRASCSSLQGVPSSKVTLQSVSGGGIERKPPVGTAFGSPFQ